MQIFAKDPSFQVRENEIVLEFLESRCIGCVRILSRYCEALAADLKVRSEDLCIVQQSVVKALPGAIVGYLVSDKADAHDHQRKQETVNPNQFESEGVKVH